MMKTSVRKRRNGGAVGAVALGGLFLALACETPTPPRVSDDDALQDIVVASEPAEGNTIEINTVSVTWDDNSEEIDQPASLHLTTGSETGNGDPLFIIDGVIASEGATIMQDLDPITIERVEVIKGSTARAQYGDRAANGVIMITLKK